MARNIIDNSGSGKAGSKHFLLQREEGRFY